MSKEKQVYHVLEDAPLAVGAGAVYSARVNMNRLGVFVGVFKKRWVLRSLDQSGIDKEEYRFSLEP